MGYMHLVQNPDETFANSDRVGRIMQALMREAQKELAKFQTNFATDPLYAFEWGKSAVKAAAMNTLLLRLANDLDAERFIVDGEVVVPALVDYLNRELRRNIGGSPGTHSTWEAYCEAVVALLDKIQD